MNSGAPWTPLEWSLTYSDGSRVPRWTANGLLLADLIQGHASPHDSG